MYIKEVKIKNIRSIEHFEMNFPKPAGWHVLIGDNGAGKTTILRSIAILIANSFVSTDISFYTGLYMSNNLLRYNEKSGIINLTVESDLAYDDHPFIETFKNEDNTKNILELEIGQNHWGEKASHLNYLETLKRNHENKLKRSNDSLTEDERKNFVKFGWFVISFGPFRRFTGDDGNLSKIEINAPRLAQHLSLFGESVGFPNTAEWLKDLKFKSLEGKDNEIKIFKGIKDFVNKSDMLLNGTKLDEVTSEGIFFKDVSGYKMELLQLSDGYRSVLSLTFELIRQLINTYGESRIFNNIAKGEMSIGVPGVVLIDEIDAHLHPTWQTRIGQWFTKYFPNIQFIVTTHSPLVCRACENGSVWRLAAPGSGNESGEITGNQKEKLIFGNILDAYGTEVFGSEPVRSEKSDDMYSKLGKLNIKFALGKISSSEDEERLKLQKILSTDAPTGF